MENNFINSFREYQKFDNGFIALNPLSKLNMLFVLGFSAMLINSWRYGFLLCILFIVLAFAAKRGMSFMKPFSLIVLIFGFFTLVIRQFSVEGHTVLFKLFGVIPIKEEGLIIGLNTASYLLAFSGAIILFFCNNRNERPDVFFGKERSIS